jgi:hypothetical protein
VSTPIAALKILARRSRTGLYCSRHREDFRLALERVIQGRAVGQKPSGHHGRVAGQRMVATHPPAAPVTDQ